MTTNYLITGANRGIGRGLVEKYLSRPNTTVVAAVRDPSHPTAKSLATLPKGQGSSLVVVKLDSSISTDAEAAIKSLEAEHHISVLDVVISNAGINQDGFSPVAKIAIEVLDKHVQTNAYSVVSLFQATYPLLERAANPKFLAMGSPMGSIGGMEQRPFPAAGYSASKAIQHWLVRKLHFENEGMIIFVMNPGFVKTDMGNAGAAFFGMKEATTSIEDSVNGTVAKIDEATREKSGGKFVSWDDSEFPW